MISDVVVGDAGVAGLGVFARRSFTDGRFIFRRRHGRIVRTDEIESLSPAERMHLCELDFERSAVLEPPGCYLNHSCEPNAMRHGVSVFAWSSIAAGEQVTIDYRLNAFDDNEEWPCSCAAPSCEGFVIGSFFSMSAERQLLLLEHVPSFIRSEYRRRHR